MNLQAIVRYVTLQYVFSRFYPNPYQSILARIFYARIIPTGKIVLIPALLSSIVSNDARKFHFRNLHWLRYLFRNTNW